jgi:magnesium transporter
MEELLKDYQEPGTPPGTLRAAEGETGAARIVLTSYTNETIETREVADAASLRALTADARVHWIHVLGLGDVSVLRKLGEDFDLHPLALEDAVQMGQRPKVEDYGETLFAIFQHVALRDNVLWRRQVSIFFCPRFVITLQPAGEDLFLPVRARLAKQERARARGTGYLAYAMIDYLVDESFPTLEAFGECLQDLEDELLGRVDRTAAVDLQAIRRELLKLRQVLWPQREVLSKLARDDDTGFDDETRLFLRDCYDHAVQALEVSENYREMASGLLDIYLTGLSNRLNEVMRVLTIISTIFMPLSFVAGVYGMNFDRGSALNMPELGWRYGYLGFWGVVLVLTGGMLYLFRRRGWL